MTDQPPSFDDRDGEPCEATAPCECGGIDNGGPSDSLLFGRIVDFAASDPARPLTAALGLDGAALRQMISRVLPNRTHLLRGVSIDAGAGDDAIEEPDVRTYLSEFRAGRDDAIEAWLVAILARRMREPNHLWQDLGFAGRHELNFLLRRHFPDLVRRNAADMKWKKFVYRELCQRDGIFVCKSPNCGVCSDFTNCYGDEAGEPLQWPPASGNPAESAENGTRAENIVGNGKVDR